MRVSRSFAAGERFTQFSDFCPIELEDSTRVAVRVEVTAFDAAYRGDTLPEVIRYLPSGHELGVTALLPAIHLPGQKLARSSAYDTRRPSK